MVTAGTKGWWLVEMAEERGWALEERTAEAEKRMKGEARQSPGQQ